MKYLALLLIFGFGISGSLGQTIKSLGYNTSNGQIVSATNVTWTNSFNFSTNTVAAQVRSNLSLGWSALTNSNAATTLLGYATNGQVVYSGTNLLTFTNVVDFQQAPRIDVYDQQIEFLENLGLRGTYGSTGNTVTRALTLFDANNDEAALYIQDSQVVFSSPDVSTNFRTALGLGGGITTNRTFVSYNGTNYTTNTVTISNGIITGWTQ